MPGNSKHSRAYKLYLREKRFWRRKKKESLQAKIREEYRHPSRQDFTDDPLAMGHSTATSETYMPSGDQDPDEPTLESEEDDFVPSTQVLRLYMSSSSDESDHGDARSTGKRQRGEDGASGKCDSHALQQQGASGGIHNPQPSTSGAGNANVQMSSVIT